MLDLESAIKHCEEVAETIENKGYYKIPEDMCECANEHRQLAEWLKELKMLHELMDEDFGTLCICALRYCHGRRSYMPSMVQRIVRNHFNYLSNKDLRVILEDEVFQNTMNLWGDECDKVDWMGFYSDLKEYMKHKEEK